VTQSQEETRESTEEFLYRFFGEGNMAWPKLDPAYSHKDRTLPFVESLQRGDNAPIVLPRLYTSRDRFVVYVVAREPGERAKTAELIRAFAGPTYITYDERVGIQPAWLDPEDPVEQAIRDFAHGRATFRLETGRTLEHRRNLAEALELMQRTEARRPPRLWRVAKPIGRLLTEFDAALSAGAEAASEAVLDQLAAGGVNATNLANLRIKRLDRLGRGEEILQLPELPDVLRQDPPIPVKEAILNAVYLGLDGPLSEGNLPDAQERLEERGRFVPALLDAEAGLLGAQAVTVLLMAAAVLEDLPALQRLTACVESADRVGELPSQVWEEAQRVLGVPSQTGAYPVPAESAPSAAEKTDAEPETPSAIDSWLSLLRALSINPGEAASALRNRSWASWVSPAMHDAALAEILDNLEDQAAEEAWRAVGAFIDAVGYDAPASMTAHAFIRNAVTFDRFGPGDLAALQALTEIALRGNPSEQNYSELLDELGAYRDRWVSPERAAIALDFVDRLFLAACPSLDARHTLAYGLLEPLWRHQGRLNEADLAFAKRLSQELEVDFPWQERVSSDGEQDTPLAELPSTNVLLYSLDEAVLARCAEQIGRLAPTVSTAIACDKAGSTQLRHKARAADLIVLATRCAKHAATGFITQHANTKYIHYADGSGSASMLRAAVNGLRAVAAGS
jgi:hypothetical protein